MKEENRTQDIKMKNIGKCLSELALESILYEIVLNPKPGLVDSLDSGSHNDMDKFLFIKSSVSLYSSLEDFFIAGYQIEDINKLLYTIRPIGISAEKDMFKATGGINTHKGVIFSFGILLASLGYYTNNFEINYKKFNNKNTDKLFSIVKDITKDIVENDFKNLDKKEKLSNGEKLYIDYGVKGIRGEAEKGYPTIINYSLPNLRSYNEKTENLDDKLLETLFMLMKYTEDSNIINRGGIEMLYYVKETASIFLKNNSVNSKNYKKNITKLNYDFIEKNISPGGSADLLSMTIFLAKLENIIK